MVRRPLRFVPDRPTVARLERRLNVSMEIASDLLKSWDEVLDGWDASAMPTDGFPGASATTTSHRLSDFGLAGAGRTSGSQPGQPSSCATRNLKYSSARHLPPYRLALLRMSEVIRGRAPTPR